MAWVMLGRKVGMTQWFDGEGRALAATVVQVEPAVVVQIKTPERDGYAALQLGAGAVEERKLTKPLLGHFKKAGVAPKRFLFEVKVPDPSKYTVGQEFGVLPGPLSAGASIPGLAPTATSGSAGLERLAPWACAKW